LKVKRFIFQTVILLVISLLVVGCSSKTEQKTVKKELYIYSGAGMQKPMDEISKKFGHENGVKVICDYAGSGYLYAKIISSKKGDLYIPGSIFYVKKLQAKKLVAKYFVIAKHIPVIVVPKGNPKHITSLLDLSQPDIKVALGDENIAIGKTCKKIFKRAEKFHPDITKKILKNVVVKGASVKQVLLYVLEKQVDAAIVWRADALENKDKIDIVSISKDYNLIKTIPVALLTFSQNKPLAEKFYSYLQTKGKTIFQKHGFMLPN